MDIGQQIADAADRLLAAHGSPDALTRAEEGVWPAALWSQLLGLGLGEAMIDEESGGHGFGWSDLAATFIAIGRRACPVPIGEHMVARALVERAGLKTPDGILTLSTRIGPRIQIDANRVSGELPAVVWGGESHHLVFSCDGESGGGRLGVVELSAGTTRPRRSISRTPHADLTYRNAEVRLAPAERGAVTLAGALLRSLQITGAIERVLADTVTYANTRVQFGRPIGRFQAIQQLVAELGNEAAASTATAMGAARALDRNEGHLAVAVAKARSSAAAGRVAAIAHEVHAAIGVTLDFSLHHMTRRLWQWRNDFGDEFYWRAELARAATAEGPDRLWSLIIAASGGVDANASATEAT